MTTIIPTLIEQEMKDSYLDYSMSVIVGRALPDIKDGLKPVHRRILYAMQKEGLTHEKKFTKCAGVVGSVLKYFHPHGDTSVYDALVRLAQPWSLRYPLVWGQGNFGSQDGDPAAAYRYTESKLMKISSELLQDIEKNTVDFVDNFDGSTKEPIVLPAKLPNLLVNGSSGIAVGMATNIPPHNLNEVCDAAIALIDNPEIGFEDLVSYLKGPDFPTGGIICGTNGIKLAYKTGRGKLILRSKIIFEDGKIIVTEIPYQVNKSLLLQDIAKNVHEKVIEGISDLRDESDRNGMRIVIQLKKGVSEDFVLTQLYKHSNLQISFGINNVALVNGEPRQLSLRDFLEEYIKHRFDVITRRCKFELDKAEKRAHILEGLRIALANIDAVVALIKSSISVEDARNGLVNNFNLSHEQAQAILEMKLSKLTSLETNRINEEYNSLLNFIRELKEILSDPNKINKIIKDDLIDLKTNYGDSRRTLISSEELEDVDTEDLIEEEEVVITLTNAGYVKRVPLDTYRAQRRGGKGLIGTGTREEDFVTNLFVSSTHTYLLCFTDTGIVHWLKAYKIPEGSRYGKGANIINLLNLERSNKLSAVLPVKEFSDDKFLVLVTKEGVVKKTSLSAYSKPRMGGVKGVELREGDSLIGAFITSGTNELVIATKDGRAVRFNEQDVRSVGRNSIGVRGINIKSSEVVGAGLADNKYILTITENGFGKRTLVEDYRLINRGGSGVINIKCTPKNGKVVSIKIVGDDDELMFITKKGVVIRTPVNGISVIGRNTQGVRIMRLDPDDSIVSVARIINE